MTGEKYNWGKKGSYIIFLIILRMLGRISRGKEDGNIEGKKIILKNGGGEEIQVIGNFIHPCTPVF